MATNEVDFSVKEGEMRALIGPNGAGKSTFFNLITGSLTPSSGRILWKGKDITTLRSDQMSQMGIARSYQITNIFPNLTTFENIRLSAQSRRKSQNWFIPATHLRDVVNHAEEILNMLDLQGKESLIAANLSHGDQRRLEIAISLATSPELLLLDEPTAGMSPSETVEMIDLIQRISKNLTIIIVEHDMKVVMQLAETISVLHYGRIIAEGSPGEISKNKKVLEVYLGGELSL